MNFILIVLMALAVPAMASAGTVNQLVQEMTTDMERASITKIAVLDFAYTDGKVSQGPAIIQERIATALVRKRVGVVVERKLIDRVMGELKFQRSGVVDERTIKQIGKVLGADYVVVGTLNDLGNNRTEVNARIIDTESAMVIGASSIDIVKSWKDEAPVVAVSSYTPTAFENKITNNLVKRKAFLDAKLAELKQGIGTSIKPREDGMIEVNGQAVDHEDFYEAAMGAMNSDANAAGLKIETLPGMANEEEEE